MRLVVTIQEILVTVSEKKKNLIIQVMLSELVIQGTKKKYVVPGTRSNGGEQRKNRSHNASVIWPETILKSAFVDNSHPTKVIN